ncbi:hypothetical protein EBU94_03600 [bacterium]|nr:hypothetical protein [bacterium]
MSFEGMIAEYRDYSQLKVFAESQFRTIVELSKKIQELEDKKIELERLLEHTNPLEISANSSKIDLNISDEEFICRTQLRMLKELSIRAELTKEEAQKVEIYSGILRSLNKNANEESVTAEILDPKALLAALENSNE